MQVYVYVWLNFSYSDCLKWLLIYILGGNLNYSAKQREELKLSHSEWVLKEENCILKVLTMSILFQVWLDFKDISCFLDF